MMLNTFQSNLNQFQPILLLESYLINYTFCYFLFPLWFPPNFQFHFQHFNLIILLVIELNFSLTQGDHLSLLLVTTPKFDQMHADYLLLLQPRALNFNLTHACYLQNFLEYLALGLSQNKTIDTSLSKDQNSIQLLKLLLQLSHFKNF